MLKQTITSRQILAETDLTYFKLDFGGFGNILGGEIEEQWAKH